jgi:hypothetical protein
MEDRLVKMEAETELSCCKTTNTWDCQKLEEARKDPLLEGLKEVCLSKHLDFHISSLHKCERIN